MRATCRSALFLLIITSGCHYNKLLKSDDCSRKYEEGLRYARRGKCTRAYPLLESCIPYYRGRDEYARIILALAECDIEEGDYETAKERYKFLATLYAGTSIEEEALYKYAYTSYLTSGPYDLDSRSIIEAISVLNMFLARFPTSQYADTIKNLLALLNTDLFKKEYEIALLYYKIEDYLAAKTSFSNLLEKYPVLASRPEVYYYLLKSSYLYALNSIPSKQHARYSEFIDLCNRYLYYLEKTRYFQEIETMKKEAEKALGTEEK